MEFTSLSQAIDRLNEIELTASAYGHAMGVLGVDAATVAPSASAPGRGKTMEVLSGVIYKLISDPLTQQNTAHWGTIACCFNHYAEGETAQIADNMDEWTQKKSAMHAESRRIFDAAVEKNTIQNPCPTLIYTTEEKEATEMIRTNLNSYTSKQEMAFITGIGADINSDADWAKFQKEMADMGLEDYRVFVQTAYDRQ
jgi:hypothetical protein